MSFIDILLQDISYWFCWWKFLRTILDNLLGLILNDVIRISLRLVGGHSLAVLRVVVDQIEHCHSLTRGNPGLELSLVFALTQHQLVVRLLGKFRTRYFPGATFFLTNHQFIFPKLGASFNTCPPRASFLADFLARHEKWSTWHPVILSHLSFH